MADRRTAAIEEGARALEARLAIWILEGHRPHPHPPHATMPAWWRRGLATSRLWGTDVLEYVEDDYPWAATLLEGAELDDALATTTDATPLALLHGGSWMLLVLDEPGLTVVKHDRVEGERRTIGPLVDVLAMLRPLTTTSFDGDTWIELVGEHGLMACEGDKLVERTFESSADAFAAYFAFVKQQLAAGRQLRRQPAGFRAALENLR